MRQRKPPRRCACGIELRSNASKQCYKCRRKDVCTICRLPQAGKGTCPTCKQVMADAHAAHHDNSYAAEDREPGIRVYSMQAVNRRAGL